MARFTAHSMFRKVGYPFDATVIGLGKDRINVQLTANGGSGVVFNRSLPGDAYHMDKQAFQLVGKKTGYTFRRGAQLTVRLQKVDLVKGEMTFTVGRHAVPHKNQYKSNFKPREKARQAEVPI